MALIRVIVSLLLLTAVSCAPPEGIQFNDGLEISGYVEEKSLFRNPALKSRARSCGGTGQLLGILQEGCIGDSDTCVVSHDTLGRAEMYFVPSASTRGLGVLTRVTTSDGEHTTFENLLPDVSIVAGQKYTLTGTVAPVPHLKGKHISGQWEVFRMADRQVEVCGEHEKYII